MKRHLNAILLAAVVLLAVIPLWIVERPAPAADGEAVAIFAGADDQAKNAISEIAPDYRPWFEPLLEPASGEIASLLFALQAALGAGFIGYYLGVSVTREKLRREFEQRERAPTSATFCQPPGARSNEADDSVSTLTENANDRQLIARKMSAGAATRR